MPRTKKKPAAVSLPPMPPTVLTLTHRTVYALVNERVNYFEFVYPLITGSEGRVQSR